jgi:hypothetical protein
VIGTLKHGDKVIVNGRTDWPDPPGYQFTGAEGTVDRWIQYGETLEGFSDFVHVRIDKAEGRGAAYAGGSFYFRAEDLIKVVSAAEAVL